VVPFLVEKDAIEKTLVKTWTGQRVGHDEFIVIYLLLLSKFKLEAGKFEI
jgi:hypothetical protein